MAPENYLAISLCLSNKIKSGAVEEDILESPHPLKRQLIGI